MRLLSEVRRVAKALTESVLALAEQGHHGTRKHGKADYTQSVRRPVAALWRGSIVRADFDSTMYAVVDRGLGRAWREGIAEFGFTEADLSAEEVIRLQMAVARYFPHIDRLAERVEQNSRAEGGKLTPLFAHVNTVWGNQYGELYNLGMMLAGADQKMEWVLNLKRMTKVHCEDCLKQAGRVYRASTWARYDVRPQSPALACCGDWGNGCGCGFRKAPGKPVTPGRPPKLSGQ